MGYIDLHLHTTHSDGSLTPEEMVMRAKAAGVTTLAIADHDVITGSIEAAPICEREGIRLIPGVEIDTLTDNTLVHVLAYFPHGDSGKNAFENERFLSLIADSREKLDGMSTILIERLAQRNANVSVEEFRAFPEHKGDGGWKALYYLAHKGVVQKPKHALGLYEQMGVLYGNQDFVSTEKAIEIIHACSGLAVMAHPLSTFGDPLEKKVLDVLGHDGIPCEGTPEAVAKAVSKWNSEDLDRAIYEAGATGGIVFTQEEWLQHPHGKHLASLPVVTIEKIADSEPIPLPALSESDSDA